MECDEHFPPIKVVYIKKIGKYVLLDGKHRLEAYILRGEIEILAYIFDFPEEHWLMVSARFNGKSSKPLKGEEIKQIITQTWQSGIKDTTVIAKEMNLSVRYVEKILKTARDEERDKRKEEILELHQQGMSQREIASEVGLSLCCVNMTLKSNEENHNAPPPLSSDEDILKLPVKSSEVPQVFYKRTEFVYRTPNDNNDIKMLNKMEDEPAPDFKEIYPIIPMEMEPSEAANAKWVLKPEEGLSEEPNQSPEASQVFPKRTELVLKTPEKSNQTEESEAPMLLIQNNGLSVLDKTHNHSGSVQKTAKYPSYLDQIKNFNEFPVQAQHAIRAIELAKLYKVDIIDIAKVLNEPILWVKKTLLSAMAISLMHGDKLNDASRVETMVGLELTVIRCIQRVLVYGKMLNLISPEMHQWVKHNLSQKDFDFLLKLVGANPNDFPHLLKDKVNPPKQRRFQKMPEDFEAYFELIEWFLQLLIDYVSDDELSMIVTKQIMGRLNKDITLINVFFDKSSQRQLL
jgi:transcriptional regulator with XRE-family HTH domain